jgi:hypothetical protein
VIRVLGDYLISDWNKQSLLPPTTSSSSAVSASQQKVISTTPPNPAARLATPHKGGPGGVSHPTNLDTEWITIESSHLESLPLLSGEGEKGTKSGGGDSGISTNKPTPSPLMVDSHVILKCIETLTNVFMRNVVKLSHYPSFDKLWLQLLQIFTYFMEVSPVPSTTATTGSTNPSLPPVPPLHPHFSQAIAHTSSEISLIQQLSAFCYAKLQLLIQCLQKEKIFKKKEGLWLVTKDFLAQLSTVNILSENSPLAPAPAPPIPPAPTDNMNEKS